MSTNWPRVSLSELLRLVRRPVELKPEQQYLEIGIYCFGGGIFHKTPRAGLEIGDKKLYELREGDLILQVTFAWEGAIALCSKAEHGLYGSTRYPTFRVDETRSFAPFLVRYLGTRHGLEQINKICPGSAGRNRVLSLKRIHEVVVPLPPLSEQRRIVARIEELATKINEARDLREQATKEAKALIANEIKARFDRGRDSGWRRATLGEFVVDDCYGTSERANDDDSGTPVLRMGNIQNGRLDLRGLKYLHIAEKDHTKFLLKRGDILVNRTNSAELVGKCAVFDVAGDYAFASYLIRLRLDTEKADSRLVASYINSPSGRAYMFSERKQMTGQANVNATKLKALPIALPSLAEQRRIVSELDVLRAQADGLKRLQAETATELDALLPSILDKAFKGKLETIL